MHSTEPKVTKKVLLANGISVTNTMVDSLPNIDREHAEQPAAICSVSFIKQPLLISQQLAACHSTCQKHLENLSDQN